MDCLKEDDDQLGTASLGSDPAPGPSASTSSPVKLRSVNGLDYGVQHNHCQDQEGDSLIQIFRLTRTPNMTSLRRSAKTWTAAGTVVMLIAELLVGHYSVQNIPHRMV